VQNEQHWCQTHSIQRAHKPKEQHHAHAVIALEHFPDCDLQGTHHGQAVHLSLMQKLPVLDPRQVQAVQYNSRKMKESDVKHMHLHEQARHV
jgi:hypothetical protein